MSTPLPRCSKPIAFPRLLINRVLHVAAAFMPAGKAETSPAGAGRLSEKDKFSTSRPTEADSQWRILHTQSYSECQLRNPDHLSALVTREIKSRNRARVSHTRLSLPTDTRRQIDLLQQCKLAHEPLRLRIRVRPSICPARPWARIFRRRGITIILCTRHGG
jgi:hypothetical protein